MEHFPYEEYDDTTIDKAIGHQSFKRLYVGDSNSFFSNLPQEIIKTAHIATRLSVMQNVSAAALWADIIYSCDRAELSLEDCIINEKLQEKSLVEQVIAAGDWRSCALFVEILKDGSYCCDKVIKKGPFLMTSPDPAGRSRGVKTYATGGYYGGEFKNGLRDGTGVWDSAHMWIKHGNWQNDKLEGQGYSEMIYPSRKLEIGKFRDGVLVKPDRVKILRQSLRSLLP